MYIKETILGKLPKAEYDNNNGQRTYQDEVLPDMLCDSFHNECSASAAGQELSFLKVLLLT